MPSSATRNRPPANREPEEDPDSRWEYGPDVHRSAPAPALDADFAEVTGSDWWVFGSRVDRADWLAARWRKRDASYREEAVALIHAASDRWGGNGGPNTFTHHKADILRYLTHHVANVVELLDEVADQLYSPRATPDSSIPHLIECQLAHVEHAAARLERWAGEIRQRQAEPRSRKPRG